MSIFAADRSIIQRADAHSRRRQVGRRGGGVGLALPLTGDLRTGTFGCARIGVAAGQGTRDLRVKGMPGIAASESNHAQNCKSCLIGHSRLSVLATHRHVLASADAVVRWLALPLAGYVHAGTLGQTLVGVSASANADAADLTL